MQLHHPDQVLKITHFTPEILVFCKGLSTDFLFGDRMKTLL
jgi:hypothetical protein